MGMWGWKGLTDEELEDRLQDKDALEEVAAAVSLATLEPDNPNIEKYESFNLLGQISVPSIRVTGKSPNILSKKSRIELVSQLQLTARYLLAVTVVLTGIITLVDLLVANQESSVWWSTPLVALLVLVGILYMLAYFTVMGFGDVSFDLRPNEGPTDDNKDE